MTHRPTLWIPDSIIEFEGTTPWISWVVLGGMAGCCVVTAAVSPTAWQF